MKVIKVGKNITIIFGDGSMVTSPNCTKEMYKDILKHRDNEEEVKSILFPDFKEKKDIAEKQIKNIKLIHSCILFRVVGDRVTIPSISELSVPEDLALRIGTASKEGDENSLKAYLNFWTLCSLNPDSRARENMFWFLNKYDMQISSSGLFVAYRNLVKRKEKVHCEENSTVQKIYTNIKNTKRLKTKNYTVYKRKGGKIFILPVGSSKKYTKKSDIILGNLKKLNKLIEENRDIYTDSYSKTFNISIGKVVSMPREDCDAEQDNTCSSGLHVAGKGWLERNYFGDTPIKVLVNPADVVAVPPKDNYGKMRVCAYYPVEVVSFDNKGNIVSGKNDPIFDDDFLDQVMYSGEKNEEDLNPHSIVCPNVPELDLSKVKRNLEKIKLQIKRRIENE